MGVYYEYVAIDPYTQIFNAMKLEVPIFDGSGAEQWFSQIDEFFDSYNTPEEWRLRLVSYHMEGEADYWLLCSLANNQLRTWPEFCFKFQQHFGFSLYDSVFKRLMKDTEDRIQSLEKKSSPQEISGEEVKVQEDPEVNISIAIVPKSGLHFSSLEPPPFISPLPPPPRLFKPNIYPSVSPRQLQTCPQSTICSPFTPPQPITITTKPPHSSSHFSSIYELKSSYTQEVKDFETTNLQIVQLAKCSDFSPNLYMGSYMDTASGVVGGSNGQRNLRRRALVEWAEEPPPPCVRRMGRGTSAEELCGKRLLDCLCCCPNILLDF